MNHIKDRKDELIPTTIRLATSTLRLLDEASHLQMMTRADLIRLSLQQTVDRWKTDQRSRIIKRLGATT